MDSYASRLKAHGIELFFHNGTFEAYRHNGKYVLEHMLEQTTDLGFELDCHWLWRGGMEPTAMIRKFAGRVRILHLKDYRIGLPAADLVIRTAADIAHLEQYAEVGEGNLDMPAIVKAGIESGCEYFMIEQDDTYGRDVYESLAISRANLIKMGYEEWFK